MNITFGDVLIYALCYVGLFASFYFFIILLENRHQLPDKRPKRYPMVTVIVPAFNEESTLQKTVESLMGLRYPRHKLEVIVIDDGSTDGTWEIAQELADSYDSVIAVHQKNGGKGSALNHGLRIARGEIVGALDADSFVHPDALRAIVSRFSDSHVVAVTPSMKIHQPKNLLQYIQEVEYVIGIFLRKVFSFVGSIHVTPGPFSLFRKSFFDTHGGYDEDNVTEDIEIALRIQSLGYYIENTLHAHVYTVGPADFLTLLKQRLRWYYGFIVNVEKYPQLLHPRTGNLGMIFLPAAFVSVLLAVASLSYTLYRFGHWMYHLISHFIMLGWDYVYLINFTIDPFTLVTNLTVLSLITLSVSICLIYIANRFAHKDKNIALQFILFSIFYGFLYGFWWMSAILYRFTGRRLKWGHKSE